MGNLSCDEQGIQVSSGEFIGFLNSDDFFADPTVIEHYAAAAKMQTLISYSLMSPTSIGSIKQKLRESGIHQIIQE